MNTPLVSVIIPIYNVSDYLDACVESACRQSYTNLEIILVDDGSADDCPQKCDEWAKKDDRIKVIHKPNGGLSDARNAGLDTATGKYIYFLDGDDTIEQNLIETVVPYMENGADMVAFNWYRVWDNGVKKAMPYHVLGLWNLEVENSKIDFLFKILLNGKIGWEAWSRIYRREKIEKYNLRFVDNRRIFAEDLYFCLCYCSHAREIVSIDKCLYNYLVRSDSIMGVQSKKLNVGRMNELSKSVLEYWNMFEDCKPLVERFPLAHFMITDIVIAQAARIFSDLSLPQLRRNIMEDITDISFFRANIKQIFNYRKYLFKIYSRSVAYEKLSFVAFLLIGSSALLRVCYRLIYSCIDMINLRDKEKITEYNSIKKKNKIFLLGTEDLGNVGDHKIAENILSFAQQFCKQEVSKEVTYREYHDEKKYLEKFVNTSDVLLLTGGGNFGNEYGAQKIRNDIVTTWSKNRKIVFPQTIYFTADEDGATALEETKKIYTKENNVVLFLRERTSFDFAQEHYSCESYLVPDIVLSQDMSVSAQRKDYVLLCLRNDKEKSVPNETIDLIRKMINQTDLSEISTDLQLDYHLDKTQRVSAINSALDKWRTSRLVITDRLHGMIFAAITGTPCIALSNYNHKISGSYEFIKYLPYIKFVKTEEEIKTAFSELISITDCKYDNTPLLPYYEKLAEELKKR
ncbi:MAG: glycosyltransferase [Clostridia bacterium]|nr:glycosyltransferase [Clostridia bacterium]